MLENFLDSSLYRYTFYRGYIPYFGLRFDKTFLQDLRSYISCFVQNRNIVMTKEKKEEK